jgi:hypothetical protein
MKAAALKEIESAVEKAIDRKLSEPRRAADSLRKLNNYPERMRVDQVAAYLNCSDQHVRNLYDCGELNGKDISLPGSVREHLRIFRSSVADYEAKAKGSNQ